MKYHCSCKMSSCENEYQKSEFAVTGRVMARAVLTACAAVVQMFVYQAVATVSHQLNMLLLVLVGLLVNGPYALITTAVSADLGTSLRGNAKALATVTAIIDGRWPAPRTLPGMAEHSWH